MSDLVGNPEDRLSRIAAHILLDIGTVLLYVCTQISILSHCHKDSVIIMIKDILLTSQAGSTVT